MIYTIEGKLAEIREVFLVVLCGGIGFKIFSNKDTFHELSKDGSENIKLFCFLYVRESQMELYGFLRHEEVVLFEMLNGVAGIGPKTALGVLDIDNIFNIVSAIINKNADFLVRTSGIGRKTAERIVLELHNKIKIPCGDKVSICRANQSSELEEILVNLGYPRRDAINVIQELDLKDESLEEKVRKVLKSISKR